MATYIKPEAIQDVSKQAKKKLKSYISPKPIIVGRAIPRNAEVGDRYYTSSKYVHIKMLFDIEYNNYDICLKNGMCRIRLESMERLLFTVPDNWSEIYDAIFEMVRQQDIAETNAERILELIMPYVKSIPALTSATASPEVMIQNGRLVYSGDIHVNTKAAECTQNIICRSLRRTDIRQRKAKMTRASILNMRRAANKNETYHRITMGHYYRTDISYDRYKPIKRSFIVRSVWRGRLKSINTKYFAIYVSLTTGQTGVQRKLSCKQKY